MYDLPQSLDTKGVENLFLAVSRLKILCIGVGQIYHLPLLSNPMIKYGDMGRKTKSRLPFDLGKEVV